MNEILESLNPEYGVSSHVWLAYIEQPHETLKRYFKLLDKTEVERYRSFYFLKDQKRFIVSRGFSKETLAKYADLEPSNIKIKNDRLGKPTQNVHKELQMSLSHSGNLFSLAVSRKNRIGIDIEYIDREYNPHIMCSKLFNVNEEESLKKSIESQKRVFYNYWTRREALIKATGITDFHKLDVPLADGTNIIEIKDKKGNPSSWIISPLSLVKGYIGVLVIEKPE